MDDLQTLLAMGFEVRMHSVDETSEFYVSIWCPGRNTCGMRGKSLKDTIKRCLLFAQEQNEGF